MIDLSVRRPADSAAFLKVIGVGGAGVHALDRLVLDGVNPSHLLACHTEMQILTASVAGSKIQVGCDVTRGLGAGGDPEAGAAAAVESQEAIRSAVEGLDIVLLLAGLGGGTGSGAAPLIARMARERGALVIALVTMPFRFEGRRRVAQAEVALAELHSAANMVICYENDRMADEVPPGAGVAQAFAASDRTLSQSIQAITALFYRKGLIHIGFDEFRGALSGGRCLFGHGTAQGNHRAFEALALAMRNPLMDKGRMLREAERILVAVAGGEDLTLNEIEQLMEEFNRLVGDRPQIFFSAAVDSRLEGHLSVSVFSSLARPAVVEEAPEPVAPPVVQPEATNIVPWQPAPVEEVMPEPEESFAIAESVEEPVAEPPSRPFWEEPAVESPVAAEESEPEAPSLAEEEAEATPVPPRAIRPVPGRSLRGSGFLNPRPESPPPAPPSEPPVEPEPTGAPVESASVGGPSKAPTQETLKFDAVTRGRFEKSEPTIVDGEDLDIPTFLRRKIRFRQ